MTRRTKNEVLQEFHHLYDVFEAYLDAMEPFQPQEQVELMRQHAVTRDRMLDWTKDRRATPSQIVAGVRSALADFRLGLKDMAKSTPTDFDQFNSAYLALRGVSFEADMNLAGFKSMPPKHREQT